MHDPKDMPMPMPDHHNVTNGTDPHHDHHDHMNMNMHDMMKMYFNLDNVQHVLFNEWKATTGGEWAYTIAAVVVLGIVFEGLKFTREYIQSKQLQQENYGSGYLPQLFNLLHITQTALHGLQYLLSYCLMLIAMTYQVYLFAAIVIGCAFGYLIFTPLSAKLRAKYQNFGDPCCG